MTPQEQTRQANFERLVPEYFRSGGNPVPALQRYLVSYDSETSYWFFSAETIDEVVDDIEATCKGWVGVSEVWNLDAGTTLVVNIEITSKATLSEPGC